MAEAGRSLAGVTGQEPSIQRFLGQSEKGYRSVESSPSVAKAFDRDIISAEGFTSSWWSFIRAVIDSSLIKCDGTKNWLESRTVNPEFRSAKPDDVEEAIPLIYSSGPHEIDYVFATGGHTAFDFIKAAFVARSSTESYVSYRVALVDGRVVGIGSFLSGAEFNSINELKLVWQIARCYGLLNCWSVMRRGMQLQKLLPPPKSDAVFIQKLGVSQDMRGKGVGTAFLTEQINIARQAGFRRCVLDVAVTNPRAQLLYERLGFRVVEERKWHVIGSAVRVPDVRRMELVL